MNITTNGTFPLGKKNGSYQRFIAGSGTFGGATLTIGFENAEGNFQAFQDFAPVTAAFDTKVGAGAITELLVKVESGTGIDIHLLDHPIGL